MKTENWIQDLAQEDNFQRTVSFSETQELEKATIDFLLELQGLFIQAVKKFNHLKKADRSVYAYRISNVREGFMLYRSGYRLLFHYKVPGKLQIQMVKTDLGRSQEVILNTELQAFRSNPLSCFKWNHKGYAGFIEAQAFVSYYFKFFVRSSRPSVELEKTSLLSGEDRSFL